MKKIKISRRSLLDILFVVSYSVGWASMVKYVTYAIFPLPESVELFLFLLLIYIIRFNGRSIRGKIVSSKLSIFLIILYLWELFQGLIQGADINALLVVIVNLLSTYIAYKYMSNIIYEKKSANPIINSFSAYMYYSIFIVIVSSVLIISHIMPQYSNQLSGNSLINTNMETMGINYFFPGCLSVLYPAPSIFLSGLEFASLSGLSHESQAMYYTIFPALFLQIYCVNNNRIERSILIIFLILTILTTSLTATVCFILTYSLHLLWKFKDRSQLKSAIVITFFIIFLVVFVITSQFGSIINAFFQEKANFESDGSSGSYSLSLLNYILSPSALLGEGIFSSTSDQAQKFALNCGYISSVIIVSFYLFFIYTSFKNIFSNKLICHAIGLASFYFFAHSLKYGIQVFNNNYIFFIVFLLSCAETYRIRGVNASYIGVNAGCF